MTVDKDIWQLCHGEDSIQRIQGCLFRVVESQRQVATMNLVDNLEEQALLEELLETSKPPVPEAAKGLHYLLQSPFRYPPLLWGSRFGRTHEPSLFYGGLSLDTALAETAYYRLLFWQGMQTPPPSGLIRSEHSSFEVRYVTTRGVRLQHEPFTRWHETLVDTRHYQPCQHLGSAMRAAGVQAFEYHSARCPKGGLNVALFAPEAFRDSRPRRITAWLCETSAHSVAFKKAQELGDPLRFSVETFLRDGELPQPA
ncbi:RES family NAD+ phosphorylase [Atopomonas sediminilitoris]|uniref:RES family NAD+ phosphorylase n=1 Tax=Atopomonas sediminilitoris TaxID=2919919 RepID=UPI001F4EC459|nr:RES family NAD+ phosphorylase [Atopomonas sediminilitoris]MCJ8169064.1 RES family NAD+ phosphorylase [Atopomonas sediminilitoris]